MTRQQLEHSFLQEDAEKWIAAIVPEEDCLKRRGEVEALCRFNFWERRQNPDYVDRVPLSKELHEYCYGR